MILESDGTQYLIKWDDGSAPTWQTPADIAGGTHSRRVSLHVMLGTLWALCGGAIVAFWAGRQGTRKPVTGKGEL